MLTYLQCIYTGPDVIFCLVTQGQQCVQICPQTLRLCYLSMQIQENSNFSQYWIDLKINFYFCTYLITNKWIYFHLWDLFFMVKQSFTSESLLASLAGSVCGKLITKAFILSCLKAGTYLVNTGENWNILMVV